MNHARLTQDTRLEARQARSKTAKKWARLTKLGLTALCLTAIWQERALYPQVHDGMQLAYSAGIDWLESTESGKSYLTAMSGFSGNGNQSQYNPITEALLKLRQ